MIHVWIERSWRGKSLQWYSSTSLQTELDMSSASLSRRGHAWIRFGLCLTQQMTMATSDIQEMYRARRKNSKNNQRQSFWRSSGELAGPFPLEAPRLQMWCPTPCLCVCVCARVWGRTEQLHACMFIVLIR